jgi:hypothetical protein
MAAHRDWDDAQIASQIGHGGGPALKQSSQHGFAGTGVFIHFTLNTSQLQCPFRQADDQM